MARGGVRTGSLLVGVAGLFLVPGVATGQIDAGQTVGQAVGDVGKVVPQALPPAPVSAPAAPAPPPSAPAQPAPRQAPPSAPAAPASSPPVGGGSAGATSSPRSGSQSVRGASGSGSRSGGKRGAGKARAAGKGTKGAGKGTVLAAQDDDALTAPEGESFSGAVTTQPDTGVEGDPELPFTGGPVLLLLAMGAVALAAGLALRTAARRRHAG